MTTPPNSSLHSPFGGDPGKARSYTFLVNPASGGGAAPEASSIAVTIIVTVVLPLRRST